MRNYSLLGRIGTAVLVVASIVYTATAGRPKASSGKKRENDGAPADYAEENVLPEYRRVFDENPIVPDGWTFGVVWSTIYAGTAAYAIYQALPSQQTNPRFQRAAPWLAISYVLNAAFGRLFSDTRMESMIGSDLVTKASLPVALVLHQQLEIGETEVKGPEQYLRIPFSLYAGWLTAASVVGTPNLLYNLNLWKPNPSRDTPVFIGVLAATTGTAYTVARRLNDPYYLLPFVAGFAGIATKQYGKNNAIALSAAAFSLAVGAILTKWLPRGKFRELASDVDESDIYDEEEDLWWEDENPNRESESYSYTSI
ncbi:tryptophan-rich sensory protein [Larkinella terrae]|uniref:Tryptophan-rich sensory protein n=1 Tax=Larkinella terrae TaxID=2025311 RepID=A0A7K0EIK1_9BACT|nr:TspO/MBR family protein [Larkinella terrae]MRS61614.1 tryptophan-rich sensory protein [Larkinella terrae]